MFLRLSLIFVLLANLSAAFSQTLLEIKEAQLREIQTKERAISDEIEALKLQDCVLKLNEIGIPLSQSPLDIAEHSAMIIGFNCDLKLAAWSFHVLSPDVLVGGVSRTNDFRKDSLIECGDGI